MKKYLLLPALAGLLLSIAPGVASAELYCPQRSSIFGTITGVTPTSITILTRSDDGHVPVRITGATIHSRGLALRPGVFAGAYGCMTSRERTFVAEEVTLAPSVSAYPFDTDRAVTIEGRIDAVRDGRVLIDSNQGHGNVWVYTNRDDLRTGELIRVRGTFTPQNREFEATSVTILAR